MKFNSLPAIGETTNVSFRNASPIKISRGEKERREYIGQESEIVFLSPHPSSLLRYRELVNSDEGMFFEKIYPVLLKNSAGLDRGDVEVIFLVSILPRLRKNYRIYRIRLKN